ncbi:MAG: DUF6517 family protein [Halobacteriota archaeon]
MLTAPSIPSERLDGWHQVDDTTDTLFEMGPVRVTGRTVVYEDRSLRERLRDEVDIDTVRRFFFAGRLRVQPQSPFSSALLGVVSDGAGSGFVDQLRERGFTDVSQTDRRRFAVDGADAQLTRYDGVFEVDSLALAVVGWVAVWPAGEEFLIGGGAYPEGISEGGNDDQTAAIRELLRPTTYREELFELIRSVSAA